MELLSLKNVYSVFKFQDTEHFLEVNTEEVFRCIMSRIGQVYFENLAANEMENTDQNNSEYGHFLCSVCIDRLKF